MQQILKKLKDIATMQLAIKKTPSGVRLVAKSAAVKLHHGTMGGADVDMLHLHPISQRVLAWLKQHDWHYHHVQPNLDDDGRTHLFVIGFHDQHFDWRCIIRICEKRQLVVFLGLLEDTVPKTHQLVVSTIFAQSLSNMDTGVLELDFRSGEPKAKICFDAECGYLNAKVLDKHFYQLANLVEHMQGLVQEALTLPAYERQEDILALLDGADNYLHDDNDHSKSSYFIPTMVQQ